MQITISCRPTIISVEKSLDINPFNHLESMISTSANINLSGGSKKKEKDVKDSINLTITKKKTATITRNRQNETIVVSTEKLNPCQ